MKKSKLFSFNAKDFAKGLAVSVFTAVYAVVAISLNAGSLTFDWKKVAVAALVGGLGYISKNFLTNSKDEMLTPEPKTDTKI